MTDLLDTSALYSTYRTINIVNVFLNLGRIFKYFGAQKRMALINVSLIPTHLTCSYS